jgi:hypothetical protein
VTSRLAVLLVLVGLGGAASAGDPPGAVFTNEAWGYKIRVPRGWNHAAMSAREEWTVQKHLSPRELTPKTTPDGFHRIERPEMWVIAFPLARQGDRGAKREENDDGSVLFRVKNPYKDYKDFVSRERWFVGGGYYFSKEEERTEGGRSTIAAMRAAADPIRPENSRIPPASLRLSASARGAARTRARS